MSLLGWLFWCWLCGGGKEERTTTSKRKGRTKNDYNPLVLIGISVFLLVVLLLYFWLYPKVIHSVVELYKVQTTLMGG